ncbi:putative F-box/FBD/LRR-repeat protein At4g03220 [Daucus carota subsp. sativus]|uniref:putative F-box/FBD/LRR-repeat protein At4g03220 n=1 Tax=Daucus carota subsp. sativus TaxID=79200 RepID=UPI0007F0450B|nr:PREDICTED: putative F-box/FBD/LRR-repeat protein At4g03220 [Daucus carota subsp. sativus]
MSNRGKKKARTSQQYDLGDEDRISRLPDELIHRVLSFVDAKQAVQTCVLSKRWELVWTSLPFLRFGLYNYHKPIVVSKFMRHVLSNRNDQSDVSHLSLSVRNKGLSRHLLEKYVNYAISHNLQCLTLDLQDDSKPINLSAFTSKSLSSLTLKANLEKCERISDCWDLPFLTTLSLKSMENHSKFSDNWFTMTCLPALRELRLDDYDLSESSFSFSLPALTTLCLCRCRLPSTVWDFPALKSIELHGKEFPQNLNKIFSALVNLQNLKVFLTSSDHRENVICCPPQLLNLSIIAADYYPGTCNTVLVSAPKLCNFTSFGIFTAMVRVPELETVNVKLQGLFDNIGWVNKKQAYLRLINMLPGLANAKNLIFDLDSIKALDEMSYVLVSFSSPFHKLKYVKLPRGFKESSMSSPLRSYLLGGSPNATFVTKLPQNHVVENSKIDADRVRHIDASVEGANKDQASSLRGERDSGLWRSHEVNSEFVCLLDRIMQKYPETFEHFTSNNKKLCTMNLNMLCTSLNDFSKISIGNVDSEMIVGYREVFSYLKNQGFNLSWVVDRLNYIEHIRFSKPLIKELHSIDCHIDDAKTKVKELQARVVDAKTEPQDPSLIDDAKIRLQDKQTLRVEKLSEIEKVFGTMGIKLVVGFIGDDLL